MATNRSQKSLFLGSFIYSKSLDELKYFHDTAIFVDDKGTIVAIEEKCDQGKAEEVIFAKLNWKKTEDVPIHVTKPGQFFFPGFIGWFIPSCKILANNQIRYSHPRISIS